MEDLYSMLAYAYSLCRICFSVVPADRTLFYPTNQFSMLQARNRSCHPLAIRCPLPRQSHRWSHQDWHVALRTVTDRGFPCNIEAESSTGMELLESSPWIAHLVPNACICNPCIHYAKRSCYGKTCGTLRYHIHPTCRAGTGLSYPYLRESSDHIRKSSQEFPFLRYPPCHRSTRLCLDRR